MRDLLLLTFEIGAAYPGDGNRAFSHFQVPHSLDQSKDGFVVWVAFTIHIQIEPQDRTSCSSRGDKVELLRRREQTDIHPQAPLSEWRPGLTDEGGCAEEFVTFSPVIAGEREIKNPYDVADGFQR